MAMADGKAITLDRSLRWQRRAMRSRNARVVDTTDLLRRSLNAYSQRRREPWELKMLAAFPPVARAINRVCSGALNMRWSVAPPLEFADSDAAADTCRWIERSLRSPNREGESFRDIVESSVRNLLIYSIAAIERQPGDDEQAFWLWKVSPTQLDVNLAWDPESDDPRYIFRTESGEERSLQNEDAFLLRSSVDTEDFLPRSKVEIAAPVVLAWIGLLDYQIQETGKPSPASLMYLGDISKDELEEFRDYWRFDVEQNHEKPSIAGKTPPQVLPLKPQSDAGLYLGYDDKLIKAIAISFDLTPRDLGYTEHDNRATAGEAASSSFADAILPISKLVYGKFSNEVVEFYFPGYRLDLNDTEPRTEKEESERAALLWEKGILTLNEARIASGYEPIGVAGNIRINEVEPLDLPIN